MSRVKKILSIVIMVVILLSLISSVYAANYTFTFTANPQTITAKLGDTVSVDLGIADIDQTTDGINAVQGDIVFDEDLFESVDLVGTGNNWSVSYNNLANSELKGRFVLSNMSNVKDSQVVAKLVAKVKANTTATTGKITLKDVYSSYGSNTTEKQTKIITVNISSSSTPTDEDNKNNTIIDNNSDNTVTPNSSTIKTNTSTQNTTNSSKTALPKAGIASWIGIVVAAILIVAIIEFIKYKRLTK